MAINNSFGGAIWTNHALERMNERGIPKNYAVSAFQEPDSTNPSKNDGERLVKQINDKTITIVRKKNEKNEWIVLSIWMDPPMEGTKDYKDKQRYKEYKKGSLGKKIWLTILKQLGV